jgi:drug/metabolite transporter (DMT)-like permease
MKELSDDELQDLLNSGLVPDGETLSEGEKDDLLAYQNLFDALGTEPEQGLPLSFAANVRRKLQEQANRKSDLRFNIMALVIFSAILGLAYGLLAVVSPENSDVVLATVIRFKWVLLTIVCGFFSLMLIDQKMVKRSY